MNNRIDIPHDMPSMLEALRSADAMDSVPKFLHENVVKLECAAAQESERKRVLEEVVCRLLASDMSAEEIAIILRVKKDVVDDIEICNTNRIKDYSKTLKQRRNRK